MLENNREVCYFFKYLDFFRKNLKKYKIMVFFSEFIRFQTEITNYKLKTNNINNNLKKKKKKKIEKWGKSTI